MKHKSWRGVVLLVLMLVSAASGVALKPGQKLSDQRERIDLAQVIPQKLGDWQVDQSIIPVGVTTEQGDVLAATYDQLVSQTYVNSDGQRVMVSFAYGSAQKEGLRAHRQEVCYSAQGFKIQDLRNTILKIAGTDVEVTQMVAVQGNRVEPVTYWFTMGDQVVRSPLSKLIVQMKYSFSGLIPDGYLFRVSSLDNDPAKGFELQKQFAERFIEALPVELQQRLLGKI